MHAVFEQGPADSAAARNFAARQQRAAEQFLGRNRSIITCVGVSTEQQAHPSHQLYGVAADQKGLTQVVKHARDHRLQRRARHNAFQHGAHVRAQAVAGRVTMSRGGIQPRQRVTRAQRVGQTPLDLPMQIVKIGVERLHAGRPCPVDLDRQQGIAVAGMARRMRDHQPQPSQ